MSLRIARHPPAPSPCPPGGPEGLRTPAGTHTSTLVASGRPRRPLFALAAPILLAGTLAIAACDPAPMASEAPGRVQILLTDAPADDLDEARVWISRVYLVPGEEAPDTVPGTGPGGQGPAGGPPFVDLFHDPENPLTFDLLQLRDGVVADLTGEVEVPAGRYRQLRLVVSEARVTLAEGLTFEDGTTTRPLQVPGGARVGIRVNLTDAIRSEGGLLSTILVDFDVNENFVFQGNPRTPAGLRGVLFTPVLRELSRTERRD